MVFMHLDVCTKFQMAMFEIVNALTRDDGMGVDRVGDTIASGKAV